MKNKFNKGLIFASFIVILSIVFSVTASADYSYYLNQNILQNVQQAKTNWCWAACSEMAGHYEYSSTNKSQWAVVSYFKGTDLDHYPNVGGSNYDVENAIQYVANNTVNYYVGGGAFTCGAMYNEIVRDDSPMVAQLCGATNHVVVLYSTKYINGVDWMNFIDPWDATTYCVKYNDFRYGTGDMVSLGYSGYLWSATIYNPSIN